MIKVWVRHCRIFSHDIHTLNTSLTGRIHNLDHRKAWNIVKRRVPVLAEEFTGIVIIDPAVIWKHHWY